MSEVPARKAEATSPKAPAQVLERPDEMAALITARVTGQQVRITGMTTETAEYIVSLPAVFIPPQYPRRTSDGHFVLKQVNRQVAIECQQMNEEGLVRILESSSALALRTDSRRLETTKVSNNRNS